MSSTFRFMVLFFVCLFLINVNTHALKKVDARHNVIELSFGSSAAQGSYNRIGVGNYGFVFEGSSGQNYEIDADDLYENSTSFGFSYGSLYKENMLLSIGFGFVDVKHEEVFQDAEFVYTLPDFYKFKLYEFQIDWNYYFSNPVKESFAPFVGVGMNAGLLNASVKGFDSQNDFSFALGLTFGADINVWKSADQLSSLAVSSVNQYQFFASDSRPKYLTIGAGLKYYFRF